VPLTLLSINEDHEIAVVEMGANRKGDIQELCAIAQPNFGLITSIGIAHLEGFGSLEVIKTTKKELYDYIVKHNGICFVNHNAASVPALFSGTNKQTIYYGRDQWGDRWGVNDSHHRQQKAERRGTRSAAF